MRRCVGGGVVEDKRMMICRLDTIELLITPLVLPPLLLLYFPNNQARRSYKGRGKKLPMIIGLKTLEVPEKVICQRKGESGIFTF